jgi:hypothetical protein
MPARMLKAEASEHELGRQVFWLMARNGPRNAFPMTVGLCNRSQWLSFSSGSWPITAAAPQRIHTVFPIFPFLVQNGEPVETEN